MICFIDEIIKSADELLPLAIFLFNFAFFDPMGHCDEFDPPSSLLKLIENEDNPGDCDVGVQRLPAVGVSGIWMWTVSVNFGISLKQQQFGPEN
ncbi:hypothetical protein Bca101_058672 [Brassica carinata]